MLEVDPSAKRFFFLNSSGKSAFSGKIEVLEKLGSNFWKLGINGSEYRVYSETELSAGSVIRGVIKVLNNSLVLKEIISKEPGYPGGGIFYGSTGVDGLVKNLYSSFHNAGLSPGGSEFRLLKNLISKRKIDSRHLITLLTDAVLKGFRTEALMTALLDEVGRDKGGGSGGKQKKDRQNSENIKKEIKCIIKNTEKSGSILFLYNHIKHSGSHWVIFPFSFDHGSKNTDGSLRIRFDTSGIIKKTVIHAEKGDKTWYFTLTSLNNGETGAGHFRMQIYSNPEGANAVKNDSFGKLRKKLQNLGIEIDDNIHDISIFDGFSTAVMPENLDVSV